MCPIFSRKAEVENSTKWWRWFGRRSCTHREGPQRPRRIAESGRLIRTLPAGGSHLRKVRRMPKQGSPEKSHTEHSRRECLDEVVGPARSIDAYWQEPSDYALEGRAIAVRRLLLMSAVESTPREQREGSVSECTKGRSACRGYELRCIVFHRSRPPFQLVSLADHSASDSCDSRSKPERFILRAPEIGARERNHIYINTTTSVTTRVLHKNLRVLQDSTAGAARIRPQRRHQQCR